MRERERENERKGERKEREIEEVRKTAAEHLSFH
jgi:hypothetical protein